MKHISFDIVLGIIYDVIVEPPSVGSTTDEFGHSKPVSLEHSSKIWNTCITSKHSSKGLIGWFVNKTAEVSEFLHVGLNFAREHHSLTVFCLEKSEARISRQQNST